MKKAPRPSPSQRMWPRVAKARFGSTQEELGSFRELEGKPGVSVKGKAVALPRSQGVLAQARMLRYPVDVTRAELQGALAEYYPWSTGSFALQESPQSLPPYSAMDKYYREYRRNFLIRGAVNTLAFWATKEGFDTVIELLDPAGMSDEQIAAALEPYEPLKDYIDQINARVNLDWKLRVAMIKAKIWGKAAFEIERDKKGQPIRLLALNSNFIMPLVDRNWQLRGFSYQGRGSLSDPFYQPEEVLYVTNNELEDDWTGISDIEPVVKEAQLDDKIVREDLTEAATTMWAGVVLWMLDISKLPQGITEAEIQTIIDDHVAAIKPGKSIATDNRWIAQVVDLKPDVDKLLAVMNGVERRILGNFGVPPFLLNVERERGTNRATALAELEAFVDGPITDIQRVFKRKTEDQWYGRLARQFLEGEGMIAKGAPLPVAVRHKWREIRTTDWFQLIVAVTNAYAQGMGFVDQKKAYEMLRDGQATKFDPNEIPTQPMPNAITEIPLDVFARRKRSEQQPPPPS